MPSRNDPRTSAGADLQPLLLWMGPDLVEDDREVGVEVHCALDRVRDAAQ